MDGCCFAHTVLLLDDKSTFRQKSDKRNGKNRGMFNRKNVGVVDGLYIRAFSPPHSQRRTLTKLYSFLIKKRKHFSGLPPLHANFKNCADLMLNFIPCVVLIDGEKAGLLKEVCNYLFVGISCQKWKESLSHIKRTRFLTIEKTNLDCII